MCLSFPVYQTNDKNCANDIFKAFFTYRRFCILIQIALKSVTGHWGSNNPKLVLSWHWFTLRIGVNQVVSLTWTNDDRSEQSSWYFYQNTEKCLQENAFQNVICKMLAILFMPQSRHCVNSWSTGYKVSCGDEFLVVGPISMGNIYQDWPQLYWVQNQQHPYDMVLFLQNTFSGQVVAHTSMG